MSENRTFTLKTSLFDRHRQLIIDSEYLEFEDTNLVSSLPTKFVKEEIESIRYGIKGIRGYRFYIGKIFCIDIKSTSGQVIKLRLKSLYRVRRKQLSSKYVEIANSILRCYFDEKSNHYLALFSDNKTFEIIGIQFNPEGIIFDEKVGIVPWEFLGTRRYYRYYSIYSEMNTNQYKIFYYIEQWNTAVLQHVVENILKMKFPLKKIPT
ncbi:hypothetical protein ACX0G9_04835 [Flavitalea flava]